LTVHHQDGAAVTVGLQLQALAAQAQPRRIQGMGISLAEAILDVIEAQQAEPAASAGADGGWAKERDAEITYHGSIWLVRPFSDRAHAGVKHHLARSALRCPGLTS
jgi:hypothetical protein